MSENLVLIDIPIQEIKDFADRHADHGTPMGPVYKKMREEYLRAYIIPVQINHQQQGASLDVVYQYVKIRERLDEAMKSEDESFYLEESQAKFIHETMTTFSGWSLDMAGLIVVAHKELTKALGAPVPCPTK